jgi:hypothetical protein
MIRRFDTVLVGYWIILFLTFATVLVVRINLIGFEMGRIVLDLSGGRMVRNIGVLGKLRDTQVVELITLVRFVMVDAKRLVVLVGTT